MNKISKLFAFITAVFLVMSLTGCFFNLTEPAQTPEQTPEQTPVDWIDIADATQLSALFSGTDLLKNGRLVADITLASGSYTISSGKTRILDLNGHTISRSSATTSAFYVEGAFTIKDSSANKSGLFVDSDGSYPIKVKASGTLTVEGGTIQSRKVTSPIWSYGNVIIKEGTTIKSVGSHAIDMDDGSLKIDGGVINCTGNNCEAVELSGGASATITGGTISATEGEGAAAVDKGTAFYITSGTASITGGTFIGKTGIYLASTNVNANNKITKISGVTVEASEKCIYNFGPINEISGGTFTATGYDANVTVYALYNATYGSISNISGGNFTAILNVSGTAYGLFNNNDAAGCIHTTGGRFLAQGSGILKNKSSAAALTSGVNASATFNPAVTAY
ncbi:MAG: hypothetical protein K5930_01425 [Treponemataceae bacterium]|nr:hypothetical protein [Treponemataceae bacterium]